MMREFRKLTSKVMPLPVNDVDTDQVIPARFLKGTDKLGLGKKLFFDWRYNADGSDNSSFVLNEPSLQDAEVLLAGDNFGCGSSREHAPWALTDWGFRAVLSTSFADIFKNNALKNGMLPIALDGETHERLMAAARSPSGARVSIDLEAQILTLPDGTSATFDVEPFAKKCLLEGSDQLGYLQKHEDAIAAFEAARGDRKS